MKRLYLLLLLAFWSAPAFAANPLEGLNPGPTVTVTEVVDGDTVIVSPAPEGARQIRLVGIQAPKLPLGRKGFKAWPLSEDSKQALEALVLNRRVAMAFGETRMDRHGRHLAHLVRDDGLWVQGEMLTLGMARVYTFPDNRKLAVEMYAAERIARGNGTGIWHHPFYIPRPADPAGLMRELGTFQLVEGRVLDAARVKGRVYLNFGANWRDDFTASLSPKAARAYAKTGAEATALQGRRIRVRGWLRKRNGPMIEVTHPEQIEVLPE
jgi:micrococcal nuclease